MEKSRYKDTGCGQRIPRPPSSSPPVTTRSARVARIARLRAKLEHEENLLRSIASAQDVDKSRTRSRTSSASPRDKTSDSDSTIVRGGKRVEKSVRFESPEPNMFNNAYREELTPSPSHGPTLPSFSTTFKNSYEGGQIDGVASSEEKKKKTFEYFEIETGMMPSHKQSSKDLESDSSQRKPDGSVATTQQRQRKQYEFFQIDNKTPKSKFTGEKSICEKVRREKSNPKENICNKAHQVDISPPPIAGKESNKGQGSEQNRKVPESKEKKDKRFSYFEIDTKEFMSTTPKVNLKTVSQPGLPLPRPGSGSRDEMQSGHVKSQKNDERRPSEHHGREKFNLIDKQTKEQYQRHNFGFVSKFGLNSALPSRHPVSRAIDNHQKVHSPNSQESGERIRKDGEFLDKKFQSRTYHQDTIRPNVAAICDSYIKAEHKPIIRYPAKSCTKNGQNSSVSQNEGKIIPSRRLDKRSTLLSLPAKSQGQHTEEFRQSIAQFRPKDEKEPASPNRVRSSPEQSGLVNDDNSKILPNGSESEVVTQELTHSKEQSGPDDKDPKLSPQQLECEKLTDTGTSSNHGLSVHNADTEPAVFSSESPESRRRNNKNPACSQDVSRRNDDKKPEVLALPSDRSESGGRNNRSPPLRANSHTRAIPEMTLPPLKHEARPVTDIDVLAHGNDPANKYIILLPSMMAKYTKDHPDLPPPKAGSTVRVSDGIIVDPFTKFPLPLPLIKSSHKQPEQETKKQGESNEAQTKNSKVELPSTSKINQEPLKKKPNPRSCPKPPMVRETRASQLRKAQLTEAEAEKDAVRKSVQNISPAPRRVPAATPQQINPHSDSDSSLSPPHTPPHPGPPRPNCVPLLDLSGVVSPDPPEYGRETKTSKLRRLKQQRLTEENGIKTDVNNAKETLTKVPVAPRNAPKPTRELKKEEARNFCIRETKASKMRRLAKRDDEAAKEELTKIKDSKIQEKRSPTPTFKPAPPKPYKKPAPVAIRQTKASKLRSNQPVEENHPTKKKVTAPSKTACNRDTLDRLDNKRSPTNITRFPSTETSLFSSEISKDVTLDPVNEPVYDPIVGDKSKTENRLMQESLKCEKRLSNTMPKTAKPKTGILLEMSDNRGKTSPDIVEPFDLQSPYHNIQANLSEVTSEAISLSQANIRSSCDQTSPKSKNTERKCTAVTDQEPYIDYSQTLPSTSYVGARTPTPSPPTPTPRISKGGKKKNRISPPLKTEDETIAEPKVVSKPTFSDVYLARRKEKCEEYERESAETQQLIDKAFETYESRLSNLFRLMGKAREEKELSNKWRIEAEQYKISTEMLKTELEEKKMNRSN